MTNALIWDFLPPKNSEEKEFAVAYFRQFHHFQGFQDVFIPENVFASLNSIIELDDNFIKTLPLVAETEKRILEDVEKSINALLWAIKKTDAYETGLTSFLAAFGIWLQARKLEAVIILPLSNPTGNFSRLLHLLSGEQRKFVECLSDDVELWFFSHFADLLAEWPYFFSFTSSTVDMLKKDPYFLEHQKELVESREKFLEGGVEKRNLAEYEKILSNMIANQKALLDHLSKNYCKHIIITKASLAPSKENWKALMHSTWKCDSFGSMLKEADTRCGVFTPYFVNFDFYPFELLKSIKPGDLLGNRAHPLRQAYSFEAGVKAEMEFALANYRKRIES